MTTYYRVQSSKDPVANLLDVERADGWVADDESAETQPVGISCCDSLAHLADYIRTYSMRILSGDVVVELEGTYCADDRDQYATRVRVESVVATHPLSVLCVRDGYDRCPCCMRDEDGARCPVCA